jgi:hypothetical protein
MSDIQRQSDAGVVSGSVTDGQTALANSFLFHYAQSHVWRNEAETRRGAGDHEGSALAEQHALGHVLHVENIRNQMPADMHHDVQAAANRHSIAHQHDHGWGKPGLDWIPTAMRTPQPADAVPINGGGLDGGFKWYPPGHPKRGT